MENLCKQVENGVKFKINLKTKDCKVGRKIVMKKGELLYDYKETSHDNETVGWSEVEKLYEIYKHSIPHERENKSYFKALSSDELSDYDMVNGEDRNVAQFRLEMYILIHGNELSMAKPEHWFWQGKDKDLIILKEWI